MTTVYILAIVAIVLIVVVTGIVFPGSSTGRFRSGRYVRRPGEDNSWYRYLDDDPMEYSGSYRDPWV
jgi:hypothetical protein